MTWQTVDAGRLISDDHPARAIWTLVGRLDLSPFYRAIENSVEQGGLPAFDRQLLIGLWVYVYSQGIGLARDRAQRTMSKHQQVGAYQFSPIDILSPRL